jgi:ornithine cyclodeaminase/alanine dehydrogenase-like protein (mu-crystallin family)
MKAIFLSRAQVELVGSTVDIEHAISEILIDAARGLAGQTVRTELAPKTMPGLLGIMPSYRSMEPKLFGAKLVCVMLGNPKRGFPAHQGIAALFDGTNGHVIGMADASAVTEMRTAALTAVATRALAGKSRQTHLVIGGGHQTLPHLIALHRIENAASITVWSRNRDSAVDVQRAANERGITVQLASDLEIAVRAADCVTMVTGATQPIIRADWLKPGSHVNAIGSSTPRVREFGEDLIAAARVFVDDRNSVLSLAGEFVGLEDAKVVDLGKVLADDMPGRQNADEITLFKSVGIGIEDLAFLEILFSSARSMSIGQLIDF